jgi:uncharacterized cupredoxin-like copper-binding protein
MRSLAFGALLTTILASGCGQSATSIDSVRTIQIGMRDFAFSPETLTLRAGEKVTLSFKNVGKLEHEFMAGNKPRNRQGLPQDWLSGAQVASNGEHGMRHAGEGVRVAPNATANLTIIVPSHGGVFEFGCFVSGHYEFGMRGRLVVDVEIEPNAVPSGQRTGTQEPSIAPTHAPMGDDDGEGH